MWFSRVCPIYFMGLCSLFVAMTCLAEDAARPEIVAHRGASFKAPENTRASVKLAWQQRTDAVEVDVYLTADKKIVAMHDRTPKRYGGPDRPVAEMTWAELRQLDVGTWKDSKWQGETVPLLEELLEMTPEGKRVFIEIKSGPELVPYLKRLLQKIDQPSKKQAIIAFSADVIAAVRQQLPHIEAYWLV